MESPPPDLNRVSNCFADARQQYVIMGFYSQQEPWRLPSRQAEFDGTDRLDAHSDDQAVTGNHGYFED